MLDARTFIQCAVPHYIFLISAFAGEIFLRFDGRYADLVNENLEQARATVGQGALGVYLGKMVSTAGCVPNRRSCAVWSSALTNGG